MVKSKQIFAGSRKDSHCICLPVIILYSVCKTKNKDGKYYIQIYSKESEYEEKKSKKQTRKIKNKKKS